MRHYSLKFSWLYEAKCDINAALKKKDCQPPLFSFVFFLPYS